MAGHRRIGVDYSAIAGTLTYVADLAIGRTIFGYFSTGADIFATLYDWVRRQSYQIEEAIYNQFDSSVWQSNSRRIVDRKFNNAFSWMTQHIASGELEVMRAVDHFGSRAFRDSNRIRALDPLTGRYRYYYRDYYYFFPLCVTMHGYLNSVEAALRGFD